MTPITVSVQDGWLLRKGWRGRWLTAYLHRYNGKESTERIHTHPWLLAFGIVLRGWIFEQIGEKHLVRRPGSIRIYTRRTSHRIVQADAITLFVGLCRSQAKLDRAAEIKTREGYCHYTEIAA